MELSPQPKMFLKSEQMLRLQFGCCLDGKLVFFLFFHGRLSAREKLVMMLILDERVGG